MKQANLKHWFTTSFLHEEGAGKRCSECVKGAGSPARETGQGCEGFNRLRGSGGRVNEGKANDSQGDTRTGDRYKREEQGEAELEPVGFEPRKGANASCRSCKNCT